MRVPHALIACCVATGMLAGCEARVPIRHRLSAPIAGPAEPQAIAVGEISASGDYPPAVTLLGEHMRSSFGGGPRQAVVDARAFVKIDDQRNSRRLILEPGQSPQEVESLVRRVKVRVDFHMRAEDGQPLTVVETRQEYTSLADPRSRRQHGLARADAPENVPERERIVRELLGRCVYHFAHMLGPLDVDETVPLRPLGGGATIAAASEGDWPGALARARQAAVARPEHPDTLFNLAVLEEHAGDLRAAEDHYAAALEQTDNPWPELLQGLDRVRKVRRRSNIVAPRPADG